MSISFHVLGKPARDNALLVDIHSGQAVERLLFDCGEACLQGLTVAQILGIDHVFFSHLHMDHVAGFDTFFRCNFNRTAKPNRLWGPPRTASILQHRFRGYLWNLYERMSASWLISEIHESQIVTTRFELEEAFADAHSEGAEPHKGPIVASAGFTVEAFTMDHRTPCIAYLVREKPRWNVNTDRLAELGLHPGPWLRELKDGNATRGAMVEQGTEDPMEELRRELLVESHGESIAYLTDFLLDERAMERLSTALKGCRTLVCEAQYRQKDLQLAKKHFHMTTVLSATLAERVHARELVLFHLSDRYDRADWMEMLLEAREIFPNTRYPAGWNLEPAGERG